ncbi:MAG TPA: hypothetical protein VLX92_21670 [Kofleriaceae bacterium]|nr:hypothetical protein [Kofleriaceae bacterium]
MTAHRTISELDAALADVRAAPKDTGTLVLIVRRPAVGEREMLEAGELDPACGLIGDTWPARRSRHTPDGSPDRDVQVTLMNARAIAAIAGDADAWPPAGDQLYVDLDLSIASLPTGARLAIGGAVVEITAPPHTGCAKFSARFGSDAQRWVNTPVGRELRLRGVNARVAVAGAIRRGDAIRRI